MTDQLKQKILRFCKKAVWLLLNPRFLLCFGIGWMITNGWSYIAAALGAYFGIGWLTAIASTYLALLWIPFTPEKIFTLAIAIALLRWLFPNDEKTLGQLREMYAAAKAKWKEFRKKHQKSEVKKP